MFRGCIKLASRHLERVAVMSSALPSSVIPAMTVAQSSLGKVGGVMVQKRGFTYRPKVPLSYDNNKEEETEERREEEMGPEEYEDMLKDNEEIKARLEKEGMQTELKPKKGDKDDKEKGKEAASPLEYYLREEMYPGLSEEIVHKLHCPEDGLQEGELLEDLPLFPNPLDHSMDEDTETDPAKIRTKPYDFNGAKIRIETRDAVVPRTWEDEQLGPPPENRKVRLRVRVKELGLPLVAAQKLVLMSGSRYNFNNDILTLTTERYPTRKQNGRYLMDLLETLVEEAKKEEVITTSPRRLPIKRGKYLPFNKDMLGSTVVKKQYEGMIVEDE